VVVHSFESGVPVPLAPTGPLARSSRDDFSCFASRPLGRSLEGDKSSRPRTCRRAVEVRGFGCFASRPPAARWRGDESDVRADVRAERRAARIGFAGRLSAETGANRTRHMACSIHAGRSKPCRSASSSASRVRSSPAPLRSLSSPPLARPRPPRPMFGKRDHGRADEEHRRLRGANE
jgi:hypothetical protein